MNKQILTDIVNSILGLSKKKKKEFIELLDDGINKRESSDLDSIKNRITALEQAVTELGGTLNS